MGLGLCGPPACSAPGGPVQQAADRDQWRVAQRAGLWGRGWQLSDRVAGRSVPYDDGGPLGPAPRAGLV